MIYTTGFAGFAGFAGLSGLSVIGGASGVSASLVVSWIDNSAIEDGFRVEKSLDGVSYSTASTVAANVTTATLTGLAFNTQYYIRVYAFNGSGDSVALGPVQIYTDPPLAPSNLIATAASPSSIGLTWTLPATEPITGYRLYGRAVGGPSWAVLQDLAAGVSSATATGLIDSTQYEFYLTGYNENGAQQDAETAGSNEAVATTLVETTPPTLVSASVDTTGQLLTLVFSEAVTFGAGGNTGFSLSATNGAVTPVYASGSGTTTLVYGWVSRLIYSTETVTLGYTQPGNGVEDLVGNDLATFSGSAVTNGSTQTNYLLSLNFEETGAPAGFTLTSGTFNWDATDWPGGVPEGAQSLKFTQNNQIGYWSFAGTADIWAYGILHIPSGSPVNLIPFRLADSSGNVMCSVTFTSAGALQITVGSSTTNGSYSFDQNYHLWLHYTKGTGANAVGEAYISTTGTKPGSPNVSRTSGTSTADVARLKLDPANTHNMWIDKIRVSATTIGSNPA